MDFSTFLMEGKDKPPTLPDEFRSKVYDTVAKPSAAGLSIIPFFRSFVIKSHLQQDLPPPKLGFRASLVQGVRKGSPAIFGIVGAQTLLQDHVEGFLARKMDRESPFFTLTSSVTVAAGSSWALAGYNGMTRGDRFWNAARNTKPRQFSAIVVRETAFLYALRGCAPIEGVLDDTLGKNPANKYLSWGIGGGIGSMVGHAPDTMLTRWQANMPIITTPKTDPVTKRMIECAKVLFRGSAHRSFGTAGFVVTFNILKETMGV